MSTTNDNPDKTQEDIDEEIIDDEIESTETEGEDEDPSFDSEEDEDEEDEQPKPNPLDKFKNKSTEEVISMYKNLEKKLDAEALKKAQKLLAQGRLSQEEKKVDEDELDLTEDEIKAMSPKEFAQWADNRITFKATKIARDIIERTTEVRENVRREIAQATKSHPHIKTNKQYREIVLEKIEAHKARGKVLTLIEACQQVDEAMGIKVGEEKKKDEPKPKPRTGVEKQEGGDSDPLKTDEEKVKDGILGAGAKSKGLGGLGI